MSQRKWSPEWILCPSCKTERFWQDEPWKRTCIPCWREKKNRADDTDHQLAELRRQNDVLRVRVFRLETELDCANDEINRLRKMGPAKTESLPADMLRRLLQLCHPDRHGGSEAAHKATTWLLERRRLSA
jgi:hypothetical protein